MARILIKVEGVTEENFVTEILAPHLYGLGYTQVAPLKLGKQRERDRRGGVRPWLEVRTDILDNLKGDSGVIISTMADYYGMPDSGQAAWPGRSGAGVQLEYPNKIEESLINDISDQMGDDFNPQRFIPYMIYPLRYDARIRGYAFQRLRGVCPWNRVSQSASELSDYSRSVRYS